MIMKYILILGISWCAVMGQLSYIGTSWNGVIGEGGLIGARNIALTPDGKYLYVTAEIDSSIGAFSRNDLTGELKLIEFVQENHGGISTLSGVRALAVSPDGNNLYVTSQVDDSLTAFAITPETGRLHLIASKPIGAMEIFSDGFNGATCAVSPDGRHVYAGQYSEGLICKFDRNITNGELSSGACIRQEVGEKNVLQGITTIEIGPRGKHLYAASKHSHQLLVYQRDEFSGDLQISQSIDGELLEDEMNSPRKIILSPDGKNAYVASEVSHSIHVFSRDSVSGELSISQFVKDDSLLHWAVDLAVHPAGEYVYVAAEISNAMSVYKRNTQSGELSFLMSFGEGQNNLTGLFGLYGVAVSPDGKHVYSANWTYGAVNFYEVYTILKINKDVLKPLSSAIREQRWDLMGRKKESRLTPKFNF